MSLAVEIKRMVFELNYIVVSNNTEIGGGGLSQIFCGRLQMLNLAHLQNKEKWYGCWCGLIFYTPGGFELLKI